MVEIHKSVQAESDLIDIWLYTNENWGAEQADLYLDQLDAGLSRIANYPELGMDCSSLRNGYRRLDVEKHMIFYCIEGEILNIIRVLHQSMDFERHL